MLDNALACSEYARSPLSDMEVYNLLVSGMLVLCLGSIHYQGNTPISSVCNKPVLRDS